MFLLVTGASGAGKSATLAGLIRAFEEVYLAALNRPAGTGLPLQFVAPVHARSQLLPWAEYTFYLANR